MITSPLNSPRSVRLLAVLLLLPALSIAQTGSLPTRLPSLPNGPLFVPLKAGSFVREDGKTVTIPAFAMSEMEITNAQYLACVTAGGCKPPVWAEPDGAYHFKTGHNRLYHGFTDDQQPVVGVSWFNAKEYAMWLSATTKQQYRLPSEAEWEYAARAGTTTRWSHGENEEALKDHAWYIVNAKGSTHPVGSKTPNAWGLYDMTGNVDEWVLDCYAPGYKGVPINGQAHGDPQDRNCFRVTRGGSWFSRTPASLASSARFSEAADIRFIVFGFRLVRSL